MKRHMRRLEHEIGSALDGARASIDDVARQLRGRHLAWFDFGTRRKMRKDLLSVIAMLAETVRAMEDWENEQHRLIVLERIGEAIHGPSTGDTGSDTERS